MGRMTDHLKNVVNKSWNFSGRLKSKQDHEVNAMVGLASEAGELLDIGKKMWFHTEKPFSFFREKIVLELGDVFYYALKVMDIFGISLKEVLDKNREKLESRHPELGKVKERFGEGFIK
jgi:NTP pyrophosphatase (non-canonical NTP hydrolase)